MRFGFGEHAKNVHGYKANKGPKTFWMPPGTETTIVLLDDLPCELCRHQLYIKGDKRAAGMRQTCAGSDPADYQNPVPRICVVCNAMLRNKVIGRKGYCYLTMVEEREFQWKGKTYKDMKQLLELDPKSGDLWKRRRDAHGGLVGARFKVYRSQKQNSARYGDDWQFIDKVDLVRHFWYSPGAKAIVEAKQKAGERIEHDEAVKLFVARYHYETMLDNYDADEALAFVEYAGGGATSTQQGGSGGGSQQSGSYGDVPPPPPSQGSPDYSVPSSQAPSVPAPPPQQQPQQPAPAQGQQTPPPPPPDPAQAQPQQQGYQPPPPPASPDPTQGGHAPSPPHGQRSSAPSGGTSVPPPPPPQTPQPAPAAAGPVGNDYNFEEGWSKDSEPF